MRDELARLRADLESGEREYQAQPYAPELRQRVAAACRRLRLEGWSWTALADGVGVAVGTIRRWTEDGAGSVHGGSASDADYFVPVEVAVEGGGPVIVLLCGTQIRGLGFEQVVAVARALR